MLASNFKTAQELRIPSGLHQAAIKLLGMMERGELVDSPTPCHNGFTMTSFWHTSRKDRAKTTGCIAGWCHHISNGTVPLMFPAELTNPPRYDNHEKYPVARAAQALRSYLVTGATDWTT